MILYSIFNKDDERQLESFIETFPLKNYRYSISTSRYYTTQDDNDRVVYSKIRVTKTNYIPLEQPIVKEEKIHRMFLETFVLSISEYDDELINWLSQMGYTLMTNEEYIIYINS
jgi:hypothetical protein